MCVHDKALYKSTFTLPYLTLLLLIDFVVWVKWNDLIWFDCYVSETVCSFDTSLTAVASCRSGSTRSMIWRPTSRTATSQTCCQSCRNTRPSRPRSPRTRSDWTPWTVPASRWSATDIMPRRRLSRYWIRWTDSGNSSTVKPKTRGRSWGRRRSRSCFIGHWKMQMENLTRWKGLCLRMTSVMTCAAFVHSWMNIRYV